MERQVWCQWCGNWNDVPAELQAKRSSGDWSIEWQDEDHIKITGPNNQECVILGGDFESALSALSAAYSAGRKA